MGGRLKGFGDRLLPPTMKRVSFCREHILLHGNFSANGASGVLMSISTEQL